MDIVKKINLDFSTPMPPEIIRVRRGDTARILEVHLFNGGLALNISAGATATLAVTKPSGVKLKKTITTEREDNVVSIALTSEMTNELGRCPATLAVTDNLTAAANVFTVIVEDNPAYEAAESGSAVLQEKTVEATHYERIVTPDPGYDGLSKVTVEAIPTVSRATPTVTIDQSTGKITAQSVQSAGYVNAGTQTKTLQLPTVAGQTVTPGITKRLIAAAGTYATGDVYVSAADASGNSIIVGKWVFHNVVTQHPPETGFDVNFKCADNTEVNRIATSVENGTWQMVFWDAADGAMFDAVVNGQFRNVAYQTIDFGAEPQIIPTAFATWLAANADYVGSGEDISAELAAQKALISDIKTALENKSAGSGFVEGKWLFGSVTEVPPPLDFYVDFICDGTSYERIIITNGGGTWQMVYVEAGSGDHWEAVIDGVFDDGTFMGIDFGATSQTVPAAFAEWLRHSATYRDIETCEIKFDGSEGVFTGKMFYTAVNGRVVTAKYESGFSTPATFTAVRNSYLFIEGKIPTHGGQISEMGSAGSGHFMVGNVTFHC
jgi:hypothetical protein